jgi:hypothetical protein
VTDDAVMPAVVVVEGVRAADMQNLIRCTIVLLRVDCGSERLCCMGCCCSSLWAGSRHAKHRIGATCMRHAGLARAKAFRGGAAGAAVSAVEVLAAGVHNIWRP